MDQLFVAQPFAFPDFTIYSNRLSQTQTAQSYGSTIDFGFQRSMQTKPELQNGMVFAKYFKQNDLQYIQPPRRNYNELEISSNALGTFQRFRSPPTVEENVSKALKQGTSSGIKEGVQTIKLVRAALAIASRAGEHQLIRERLGTSQGPHKSTIPTMSGAARIFADKMSKMMDNDELRETLWTFGVTDVNGGFRSRLMSALKQDAVMPGINLAAEANQIDRVADRNAMIRNLVNQAIRFQRSVPSYGKWDIDPKISIMRVARQHRTSNQFKPTQTDRFT